MLDDTRPDSEFESLPELGPLPLDDFSGINDWDPRITERPPVEDYGIPGIDLDNNGQIKVPKVKPRGAKADYCLLEEARGEFFMGMKNAKCHPTSRDKSGSLDKAKPARAALSG